MCPDASIAELYAKPLLDANPPGSSKAKGRRPDSADGAAAGPSSKRQKAGAPPGGRGHL
jgi:hypothetical protein